MKRELLASTTRENLEEQIQKYINKGYEIEVPIQQELILFTCVMLKPTPATRAEVLAKAREAKAAKASVNNKGEVDAEETEEE
jgi:hypothetical protein